MNNFYNQKIIRLPVKIIDGVCEYFYGGKVPIKKSTVADLVIDECYFTDKEFLAGLKKKTKHKILEESETLLVALTIKSAIDSDLKDNLIRQGSSEVKLAAPYYYRLRSDYTQFVRISISSPTKLQKEKEHFESGGVWLELQGLEPKGVVSSTLKLPEGITNDEVISLNHAFTILSEKYEPWRKSHTGNIYDRVLYQEKNSKWYPIECLRNIAIVKEEHQLIQERWKAIAKELNLDFMP